MKTVLVNGERGKRLRVIASRPASTQVDPLLPLDEVLDQAEHDVLVGIAGLIAAALLAFLSVAAVAIILLSLGRPS